MSDDPYLIPGTSVLQNKLGIKSPKLLDQAERQFTTQRASEGVPVGDFNLTHLKAIHRHLFQDVYTWAGELRTVEISKNGMAINSNFANISKPAWPTSTSES